MRRASLTQGLRQLVLVVRDRLFVVVEGAERGRPLLRGHRPGLLEAAPDKRAGSFVIEQQRSLLANEERRRGDARQQVAGENQLERLLVAHA